MKVKLENAERKGSRLEKPWLSGPAFSTLLVHSRSTRIGDENDNDDYDDEQVDGLNVYFLLTPGSCWFVMCGGQAE